MSSVLQAANLFHRPRMSVELSPSVCSIRLSMSLPDLAHLGAVADSPSNRLLMAEIQSILLDLVQEAAVERGSVPIQLPRQVSMEDQEDRLEEILNHAREDLNRVLEEAEMEFVDALEVS